MSEKNQIRDTRVQQKRKRKVKFRKRMRQTLLMVVVLSLIAIGAYQVLKKPRDVIQLSFGTVPITSPHSAVILRDELVVLSMNNGVFTPDVIEGERVKKNQRIGALEVGSVSTNSSTNSVAVQPTQPNPSQNTTIGPNAVGTGAEAPPPAPIPNPDTLLVDEKTLQSEIDAIYTAMLSALKGKRFIEAENMKKELSFKLDRLKRFREEAGANAFYLQAARTGQVGSPTASEGTNLVVQASEPGLVSFTIDGMEGSLLYENRYQITFDQIFGKSISGQNRTQMPAISKQPLFKIIRPEVWYLACAIDPEEFALFSRESKVDVMLEGERLESRVEETFASGETGVLILRLNQQSNALFSKRTLDVTLIRDEVKGLILPKDALVQRNNQSGVYAVDNKRQVVFVPVSIIAERDNDYVIYEGHYIKTDAEGNTSQIITVKHGDQILSGDTKRKEGDIIE